MVEPVSLLAKARPRVDPSRPNLLAGIGLAAVRRSRPPPTSIRAHPGRDAHRRRAGWAPIGAQPKDIDAGRAVPPERPPSHVEDVIESNKQATEAKMEELGVPDPATTLRESNEPDMVGAVEAKDAFDADAAAAPAEFRQAEAGERGEAQKDNATAGTEAIGAMFATRGDLIGKVQKGQHGGKAKSESQHDRVKREVGEIYASTKTSVQKRLADMQTAVFEKFDTQSKAAMTTFENEVVDAEKRWNDKSTLDRALDQIASFVTRLPTELEAELRFIRLKFILEMTRIVREIAVMVSRELKAAKEEVKTGRAQIKSKIESLGDDQTELKAELTKEFDEKFDALEWLTGAVSEAGIVFPPQLDAEGILSLFLQITGLSVAHVTERARAIWGDKVVDFIEKVVSGIQAGVAGAEKVIEFFQVLRTEGVAGLVRLLKEKIIALKDQALDSIKSALAIEVVAAAIQNLLSLLTPASALVQAVIKIVNVVLFFIQNAGRISELINTIAEGARDVVAGNISGLAAKVEGALARTIPIVIDFLAALIGIGSGIVNTIKKAIAFVRAAVDKAIDAVLNFLKNLALRVLKALGLGPKEKAKEGEEKPEEAPRTPEAIRDSAFERMHEPISEDTPEKAIELKEQQAAQIISETEPLLPPGKVLVIKVDKVVSDAEDGTIEYSVSLSPPRKGSSKWASKRAADEMRDEITGTLQSPWFRPGPFAKESTSASDPHSVPAGDQREVNRIGKLHGDHHTGVPKPGQANWTGDHQPVTKLVEAAQEDNELRKLMKGVGLSTTLSGQRLYPHSANSFAKQGGTTSGVLSKAKKLHRILGDKT